MDVSPKQIVSVATALIPFLEHDDANRALMGANMQKQAVPLVRAEAPYIGTGVEARAARDAADMVLADGRRHGHRGRRRPHHRRVQDARAARSTGSLKFRAVEPGHLHQPEAAASREGDKVKKGDILADGPSTDNGELALGKNLLVAFMPWEGYNFEDAIILSERLVKDDVLTSIHIHEHEIDARDTKLGPEEITRDIPNLSEEILADLDERGIIRIGAEVGAGDVLVGKVTPKGETELTPEERLLRAIFGEKAREVRDTSPQGAPRRDGQGHRRQGVQPRRAATSCRPASTSWSGSTSPRSARSASATSWPAATATRASSPRSCPIEDMPFTGRRHPRRHHPQPPRRPVPHERGPGARGPPRLRRPLGLGRSNGKARSASDADPRHRGQDPHRTRGRRRSSPRRCSTAPTGTRRTTPGKHPTIQQIFENLHPESPTDGDRLIQPDGKATLYNGRTGEPYDNPITVGYVYILKLAHLVDDKIHARSTGPYSMITQQPLGGKAQFGGQRFGEMEVWALEAYGAAYCLQELLTIKSDDVLGRVKVYEAIVKGENIPEPGIPESFKVLIKEMQALCLNVEVLAHDRRGDRDARARRGHLPHRRGAGHRPLPARAGLRRRRRRRRRPSAEQDLNARRQQLRPAPDRPGHRGLDPHVVQRRGQEAGDHQLPHAQAGEGRALLREDLRSDQGLGVLLRQVQARPLQGHHLRALRRRGHPLQGPARAHGPHRAGRPRRAHLVPPRHPLVAGLPAHGHRGP